MENKLKNRTTQTVSEVEAEILQDLGKDFSLLNNGLQNVHNLFSYILEAVPKIEADVSISRKVCNHIFMKIFDDLRSAYLLGFRGYPIQTATIVASLYESAFMLCYIGEDNELATKWILHNDMTKLFISAREMTKFGLRNIIEGDVEVATEKEYAIYQQLCLAKHGNPLIQKTQGYEKIGSEFFVVFGPKNTKQSQHVIWFSIGQAIRYSVMACSAFAKYHVPENYFKKILHQRDACLSLVEKIAAEGKRRGT
jgi:hypothetical protein